MKLLFSFSLLLVSGTVLFAQRYNAPEDLDGKPAPDSLRSDLLLLYNLCSRVHPGFTTYTTREKLNSCRDSLLNSIDTNTTLRDFYRDVRYFAAKIHDGHTEITTYHLRQALEQTPVFPFRVYGIEGAWYLGEAATAELKIHTGKRILSLNGIPVETAIGHVRSVVSLEGRNETALNYAFRDFPLLYYLFDTAATFQLRLADVQGANESVSFQGISYADFSRNTRTVVPCVSRKFGDSIAILTVNTFLIADYRYAGIDYETYFRQFFREVRKRKIAKVIIDVRGNGGGDAEVANCLYSWLTDQPYDYFDYVGRKNITGEDSIGLTVRDSLWIETRTPGKDRWWFERQKGRKNCFKGTLALLTDGGSFSTTGHFVALLKTHNRAKLYGECTHGSWYSNAGSEFVLPNSRIGVIVPTTHFQMLLPEFDYDPQGICPDVTVRKSPEDLRSGHDPVMQKALHDFSGYNTSEK